MQYTKTMLKLTYLQIIGVALLSAAAMQWYSHPRRLPNLDKRDVYSELLGRRARGMLNAGVVGNGKFPTTQRHLAPGNMGTWTGSEHKPYFVYGLGL